jgi:hypothetical protein
MAPRATTTRAKVTLTAAGVAGLAVLVVATATLTGMSVATYRGGFLVVALGSAAVILAAVTVPLGPLARAFSLRPVVWLGTISYAAYLWHFPVAVFLDASRTGLDGPALLAVRVAVTLAVSAASWVLVERPVLEGTFWRQARAAGPAVAVLGVTAAVVVAATVVPAAATDAGALRTAAPALPPAVRASLVADRAFSGHPVRFLLLGDSVAVTMGVGLGRRAVPGYGVDVINQGVIGCDLDTAPATNGVYRIVPKGPCQHWRSRWARQVAVYHPRVVGLVIGFWTVCDHYVDGHDVHIGEAGWDTHLASEYRDAVRILGSRGARVVLLTSPDFDLPFEQPDGQALPENDPTRVDELNRLLRAVAAGDPDVTVVDLHRFLDPGGRFTPTLDGIALRWSDGIHVTVPGGQWLQARILPPVAALGEGLPVPRDGLPVAASPTGPAAAPGTARATTTAAGTRHGPA